jgi:hypothetical protein
VVPIGGNRFSFIPKLVPSSGSFMRQLRYLLEMLTFIKLVKR